MRFARGNVGTKSFHAKTATDLRISAKERAAVETAKNQPSRDFRSHLSRAVAATRRDHGRDSTEGVGLASSATAPCAWRSLTTMTGT